MFCLFSLASLKVAPFPKGKAFSFLDEEAKTDINISGLVHKYAEYFMTLASKGMKTEDAINFWIPDSSFSFSSLPQLTDIVTQLKENKYSFDALFKQIGSNETSEDVKNIAEFVYDFFHDTAFKAFQHFDLDQQTWSESLAVAQNLLRIVNNHHEMFDPLLKVLGITEQEATVLLQKLAVTIGNKDFKATEVFDVLNLNVSFWISFSDKIKDTFADTSIPILNAFQNIGISVDNLKDIIDTVYKAIIDPQEISFKSLYDFFFSYTGYQKDISQFIAQLTSDFVVSIYKLITGLIPSFSGVTSNVFNDLGKTVKQVSDNIYNNDYFFNDLQTFYESLHLGKPFPRDQIKDTLKTISNKANDFITSGINLFSLIPDVNGSSQQILDLIHQNWDELSKLIEGKFNLIQYFEAFHPLYTTLFTKFSYLFSTIGKKDSKFKEIVASVWDIPYSIMTEHFNVTDFYSPDDLRNDFDKYVNTAVKLLSGSEPIATDLFGITTEGIQSIIDAVTQYHDSLDLSLHDFINQFGELNETQYNDIINKIIDGLDLDKQTLQKLFESYVPFELSDIQNLLRDLSDQFSNFVDDFNKTYPDSKITPVLGEINKGFIKGNEYIDTYLKRTIKEIFNEIGLGEVCEKIINELRPKLQNKDTKIKEIVPLLMPPTFLDISATYDELIKLKSSLTISDLWNSIIVQEPSTKKGLKGSKPITFKDIFNIGIVIERAQMMKENIDDNKLTFSALLKDIFNIETSDDFFEAANKISQEANAETTDLNIPALAKKLNIPQDKINSVVDDFSAIVKYGVINANKMDTIIQVFVPPPPPSPPSSSPADPTPSGITMKSSPGKGSNKGVILGAVFGSIGGIAIVAVIIVFVMKKRNMDSYSEVSVRLV